MFKLQVIGMLEQQFGMHKESPNMIWGAERILSIQRNAMSLAVCCSRRWVNKMMNGSSRSIRSDYRLLPHCGDSETHISSAPTIPFYSGGTRKPQTYP